MRSVPHYCNGEMLLWCCGASKQRALSPESGCAVAHSGLSLYEAGEPHQTAPHRLRTLIELLLLLALGQSRKVKNNSPIPFAGSAGPLLRLITESRMLYHKELA